MPYFLIVCELYVSLFRRLVHRSLSSRRNSLNDDAVSSPSGCFSVGGCAVSDPWAKTVDAVSRKLIKQLRNTRRISICCESLHPKPENSMNADAIRVG